MPLSLDDDDVYTWPTEYNGRLHRLGAIYLSVYGQTFLMAFV